MAKALKERHLGSIPGPDDVTRTELPNGIVVLARGNRHSASITLSGYLPAGSLFDPDEQLGLADFTASALMRGTSRRDFNALFDALESIGASLGFSGGTHSVGFSGKALAEDLDSLLELLAEVLRQPVFPKDQTERLRAQLLTSLALRAQDTGQMAALKFDQLVYPGHPYSRPDDGYPETVLSITRGHLAEFHRKHYGPRGLTLAIVGGVEPGEVADKVQAVLGDWANPEQPEPPELPDTPTLGTPLTERTELPGKFQSDIVMGAAGPRRRSPDYLAAAVGNNILGRFGLYGRIGDVVREQAGLAYYAYSSLNGGTGPGPWTVLAGVNPANEQRAVDLIDDEIRRFVSEPVSEEELRDSQTNFIGRLPLSLESNAGVAGALLNLERFELGLDYYRRYPALVEAVTREQIMEAAAKYLDPDRLAVAIAGPPPAE